MSLTKAHSRMVAGSAINVIDFGAVGDGVTDDTTAFKAALVYASANNLSFFTPNLSFVVSDTLTLPQGLFWQSDNSQILFVGSNTTDPCVYVTEDDVTISGLLRIDMSDVSGGVGTRAPVVVGNIFTSASGPKNFTFDVLYFSGGHTNMNGLAIYGDANNVYGGKVACDDTSKIARIVLAHWGNFNQHFLSGGTYQHAVGAAPTTHPHDVFIDEIVCGDMAVDTGDFAGVLVISAGYNFNIKNVRGNVLGAGSNPTCSIVTLTAGDLGFAYAPADVLSHGMKNINIGSVSGKTGETGINRIGVALYAGADSTPQPAENYYAKIQECVTNVDITGSKTLLHSGISGTNALGNSWYGKCRFSGFLHGVSSGNLNNDMIIDSCYVSESQKQAVLVSGSGVDATVFPKNFYIKSLTVDGTGEQASINGEKSAFLSQKIFNVRFDSMTVKSLASGWISVGTNSGDTKGLSIGSVFVEDAAVDGAQTIVIADATSDFYSAVNVQTVIAPSQITTPVSGGIQLNASGRVREFHIASDAVPSGIEVKRGDRFWCADVVSGKHALIIVTTGGITGSTAVLKDFLLA